MPIDPDTKQVSIYNFAGNTDVVVDLDGYYSPHHHGSLYYPLVTPARIVDTRPGSGKPYSGQTLSTGTILTTNVPADNFPPVTGYTAPSDFTGFDVNTTITDTTGDGGYLTQYPSNAGSTPAAGFGPELERRRHRLQRQPAQLGWDAGHRHRQLQLHRKRRPGHRPLRLLRAQRKRIW